ncbi:hypothetical protein H8959_007269 [Pygathrix nigripes]
MGFLCLLLKLIPLDKTHIHKALQDKPLIWVECQDSAVWTLEDILIQEDVNKFSKSIRKIEETQMGNECMGTHLSGKEGMASQPTEAHWRHRTSLQSRDSPSRKSSQALGGHGLRTRSREDTVTNP